MSTPRDDDLTILGKNEWHPDHELCGIKRRDRRQHVYVVGKSGTGKTTTLTTLILQDIKLGEGVAVIDPHGDLAESLLDFVPRRRINDVVYFNPADQDHPIAFNVLETSGSRSEKVLVASGLVSVFKKIWSDSWGPRLEYILRNAILALLDTPGSTLLALPRLLSDPTFRDQVVSRVSDPIVRNFWEQEFPQYSKNFKTEAVAPILNKVGQFLSSSLVRNIVSQPHSTFDPREAMANKKIVIVNLSKGRIGEDNAALLGAMMITKFQLAAMDRARIPEREREDFYLYVDEFQNFATDSFESILSEARKYRLCLTLAHQYIEQLPESLRAAVFGNVGTLISFRVGIRDARELEPEFYPQITEQDMVNFDNYRACVKLSVDGKPILPFAMSTVLPDKPELSEGHRDTIIKQSRRRYGRPRQTIE